MILQASQEASLTHDLDDLIQLQQGGFLGVIQEEQALRQRQRVLPLQSRMSLLPPGCSPWNKAAAIGLAAPKQRFAACCSGFRQRVPEKKGRILMRKAQGQQGKLACKVACRYARERKFTVRRAASQTEAVTPMSIPVFGCLPATVSVHGPHKTLRIQRLHQHQAPPPNLQLPPRAAVAQTQTLEVSVREEVHLLHVADKATDGAFGHRQLVLQQEKQRQAMQKPHSQWGGFVVV